MDKMVFKTCLAEFCDNYNFEVSEGYIKLLYGRLNDMNVTSDQFKECTTNCIMTKKRSEFYGRPSVADWLEMLNIPTYETIAYKRVNELWKFLQSQCYRSFCGDLVKDFAIYEHDFNDSYINIFIEQEYNSLRNLTDEYITAFEKGEQKWLKKEIEFKMKRHTVHGSIPKLLSNKLNMIEKKD